VCVVVPMTARMFTTVMVEGVPTVSRVRRDTHGFAFTLDFADGKHLHVFLDGVADADGWADLFCAVAQQIANITDEEPITCPI